MTIERCSHCGASMKKYWHKITPGICTALIKINKAVNLKKVNDVRIDKLPTDLALTHVERCNWQKLRLHGLVARVRESGYVKRGRWCITRKGYKFLMGQEIPERVMSFRNRVEGHSPEVTTLSKALRGTPWFESIDDIKFEYAEPYQEGDAAIDDTPVVYGRKRLKKGTQVCPNDGSPLRRVVETTPKDENTVFVKKGWACNVCSYRREDV